MKKILLLLMITVVPMVQANPGAGFIARMTAKYSITPREYVMAGMIGGLLLRNAGLKLQHKIEVRTLYRCANEMKTDAENEQLRLNNAQKKPDNNMWWYEKCLAMMKNYIDNQENLVRPPVNQPVKK
jgi:hypothetical protein